MVIKLEKGKIIVGNWRSREELIRDMREEGIKVKCSLVSRRSKKGGGVGPALGIRFVTAESDRASVFKDKTKEKARELLGLRTEEDCERVNRELES